MAQAHSRSGDVIPLQPLGAALPGSRTQALLKAHQLELVRVVLLAGQTMREHRAPGEITVLCVEGRVDFTMAQGTQRLGAGDLLHLAAGEPHALTAVEDASLLVTICLGAPR